MNSTTCHSYKPSTLTMNAVRSNNMSLKYQRFTSSGCKDIRITKIKFVAKTQFLWQLWVCILGKLIFSYLLIFPHVAFLLYFISTVLPIFVFGACVYV